MGRVVGELAVPGHCGEAEAFIASDRGFLDNEIKQFQAGFSEAARQGHNGVGGSDDGRAGEELVDG